MVFITVFKEVGRDFFLIKIGEKSFLTRTGTTDMGAKTFFSRKKGARTFLEKVRGEDIFLRKRGAKNFLHKFPQTWHRYPVNFDQSQNSWPWIY